jgi:hypothetical protein
MTSSQNVLTPVIVGYTCVRDGTTTFESGHEVRKPLVGDSRVGQFNDHQV